jgi:hypothetical protein
MQRWIWLSHLGCLVLVLLPSTVFVLLLNTVLALLLLLLLPVVLLQCEAEGFRGITYFLDRSAGQHGTLLDQHGHC